MNKIGNITQAWNSEELSDLHKIGNGRVKTGAQIHQIPNPALAYTALSISALTGFRVSWLLPFQSITTMSVLKHSLQLVISQLEILDASQLL